MILTYYSGTHAFHASGIWMEIIFVHNYFALCGIKMALIFDIGQIIHSFLINISGNFYLVHSDTDKQNTCIKGTYTSGLYLMLPHCI